MQCYAQHAGKRWLFFQRQKRFENWKAVAHPPVEDWLALLDSVRRRINRRLLRPEEEEKLVKMISALFPGANTGAASSGQSDED